MDVSTSSDISIVELLESINTKLDILVLIKETVSQVVNGLSGIYQWLGEHEIFLPVICLLLIGVILWRKL